MNAPATRHKSPATSRPAATPSLRFALGRRGDLTLSTSATADSGSDFRFQVSVLSPQRKRCAFTLIELLVVIAIIAILAGLAFPAVQGALGQGRKAQARNDVNQLAAAVKAFQLEYGRLPASANSTGDVVKALIGSNAAVNPRNTVFFEPKIAKGGKGGWDNATYRDPWGMEYEVTLDLGYSNKITKDVGTGSQTYFTTVIVQSAGPDTNLTAMTDNISNVR